MNATKILDREFLELRAKILQLAASLDRLDRATGSVDQDPRTDLLRRGFQILLEADSSRAQRVQLLFSRPFSSNWRNELEI